MKPLFSGLIDELSKVFLKELPWLNNSFGKAQKLDIKNPTANTHVNLNYHSSKSIPAIWLYDTNEYQSLLPDTRYGNYCFFTLNDPQFVSYEQNRANTLTCDYDLVFWFNISTINKSRDIDEIKQDVLTVITRKFFSQIGSIKVTQIIEKNVFGHFDDPEIDGQYLMHPYAGLRLNGTMKVKEGIC